MKRELTAQQLEMLERFKALKVGALFSQMGTGKTRVAVELVNYNNPDYLLYVCPFSCKDNVDKELIKWEVKCPYKIVGYETLSASDRIYTQIREEMLQYKHCFIIADESIFIKNGTTKRNRRCMDLRRLCEWALVLNGTPIVNNERDIYNQMEFLSPEIFKMRYGEFLEAYFVEHHYRRNCSYGVHEFSVWTFYEPNRPAFSKVIAPYVYMADLVFEHEEYETTRLIEIDPIEYAKKRDKVLDSFLDYCMDSVISLFTVLASAVAEDEWKNRAVAEYIDGRKCIVYCTRKEEIRQIQSQCDCYVIDGDTKDDDRKRIVQEFTDGDSKPLVLSFGVGSYSLNLQTASEIVYSSLTFNYGQYEQSRYRIKRMGQDQDIQYTYILGDCGITQMMRNNLNNKGWLASEIKRHIVNSDVKDWIEKITKN